jgi:hypothetical protein
MSNFEARFKRLLKTPSILTSGSGATNMRICDVSPTIFFSARPVLAFGFWSSAITRAIPGMVPTENSEPLGKRLNTAYYRFSNSRFYFLFTAPQRLCGRFWRKRNGASRLKFGSARRAAPTVWFSIWCLLSSWLRDIPFRKPSCESCKSCPPV